uniref:GTP binding protein 3, mitochondrial n=1 Tax=Homo sapiens TaxID=9606 RepID=M0QXA1_HUMAN
MWRGLWTLAAQAARGPRRTSNLCIPQPQNPPTWSISRSSSPRST